MNSVFRPLARVLRTQYGWRHTPIALDNDLMSEDLEHRVLELEARFSALGMATAEGLESAGRRVVEATHGTVAAIVLVLEQFITEGAIDRERLVSTLQEHVLAAERANCSQMSRLAADGLLATLRHPHQAPFAAGRPKPN